MADDIDGKSVKMDALPSSQALSPSIRTMTLEQECDSYKEKLVHMKMAMREMQHSLQSQKRQKEGAETVSTLLKEARQQIATLENQKRALETAVRNLQNRLANHGLSNSVTFEENELFIPGTSKQILDNLAKENARLRNLIGSSGTYEDVSKLHETIQQVQTVNSNLQIQKDNLEQKCTDLESVLKSSDSEKDRMLSQLQERVEKLQINRGSSPDVLSQSTSGEVSVLRQQLRQFVLQCQQLEVKLEDADKIKETKVHQPEKEGDIVKDKSESDTPDGNILVEENSKLQKEIQTLKEMNRRWQDYNNERERYTQELNSNYRELQAKFKRNEETRITEERERQLNNLIITAKDKIEKMGVEKTQLEERLLLQEKTIENQANEIQRLHCLPANTDEETITALKAQIQVCTEDFETERRDRAKAQGRVQQLVEELQKQQWENQQLKTKMLTNHPVPALQPRQAYNRHQSMMLEKPQLQARGWQRNTVVTDGASNIETDSQSDRSRGEQFLLSPSHVSSGPVSLPVIRSDSALMRSSSRKNEDSLCCPKCAQGFSEEEQDRLLEHMEICCE